MYVCMYPHMYIHTKRGPWAYSLYIHTRLYVVYKHNNINLSVYIYILLVFTTYFARLYHFIVSYIPLHTITFFCILLPSITFFSIPLHSITLHAVTFHYYITFCYIPFSSIPTYSVPFYFHSIPFCSNLLHSIAFCCIRYIFI